MSHLKSLSAPKTWPVKRKGKVYVTKQNPGPHNLETSIPLSIALRDMLMVVKTTRDAKKILLSGKVLVNNIIRKDFRFPVGIMDTLSLPDLDCHFRMVYNKKGKLMLHKINKEDSLLKYSKIINKTSLKGKKLQINFYDGTNLIADKKDYNVGDTLILSGKKIVKHLKFDKGAFVYLISGKHIGMTGKLEQVQSFKGSQPDRVILKNKEQKIETLKKYLFVIEKEFGNE